MLSMLHRCTGKSCATSGLRARLALGNLASLASFPARQSSTTCCYLLKTTLCFCSELNHGRCNLLERPFACGECVCVHSNNGFENLADSHITLLFRDLKQRLNLLQSRTSPVLRLSQSSNGNRACLTCTWDLTGACPYTVPASIRVCNWYTQVFVFAVTNKLKDGFHFTLVLKCLRGYVYQGDATQDA